MLRKQVASKKQAAGKDGNSMSLRNVGELIPDYTASQVLFIDLKFSSQLPPPRFIIILPFAAANKASHFDGLGPRHAACYVKRSDRDGSFAGGISGRWQ
jgi:hypothetical protein